MLALNASVEAVDKDGLKSHCQLADFSISQPTVQDGPLIITEIQLPLGRAAAGHARIARTPMDRCIVAAVVVVSPNGDLSQRRPESEEGRVNTTRTALCGVGPRPQLAANPLTPYADFKGSAEYRTAMAEVVNRRARAAARDALHWPANTAELKTLDQKH